MGAVEDVAFRMVAGVTIGWVCAIIGGSGSMPVRGKDV